MQDLNENQRAHAEQRLRENIIVWISTVRPDDRPHIVPVWFLWDNETVLIFSKPDQKIRNLKKNPRVMLALDDTRGGDDVIMIEGEATLLDPSEVDTTMPAYAEKYGELLKDMRWTPQSMAQDYTQPIRVKPARIMVA